MRPEKHPIILGLIAVLLWCFSGACFRRGSDVMGSPMVYLTWITGLGSATALVIQCLRRKPLLDMIRLPPGVMVAGFFGVALYTVMLAFAFGIADQAELGQINLLNYLWPVWMVVLGIVLLGNQPRIPVAIAGILVGLIGVIVSRGSDLFGQLPSSILPHLLALVGGLFWALYVVLLRKWEIPEAQGGTAFHFAICALLASVLAAVNGEWATVPPVTGTMIFWIAFGGVGPVGLAYTLYESSVKNGPVLLIASFAYLIPIGSSIVIGLLFREAMTMGLLVGAVLIAVGAWLIRRATVTSPRDGPGAGDPRRRD
jgi:drug/metabolite transporter (DMT)-like permease